MQIRNENAADTPAIRRVITEAMKMLAQATGTEADIVENLRAAGALRQSLVAEETGGVCGYLAASPGRAGTQEGWGLIGPLAVLPSWQRRGVGSALMAEALCRLRRSCRGVALVGDPAYYGRFGFHPFPELRVTGCPPEVVLALSFDGSVPRGELIHHPAFGLHQQG